MKVGELTQAEKSIYKRIDAHERDEMIHKKLDKFLTLTEDERSKYDKVTLTENDKLRMIVRVAEKKLKCTMCFMYIVTKLSEKQGLDIEHNFNTLIEKTESQLRIHSRIISDILTTYVVSDFVVIYFNNYTKRINERSKFLNNITTQYFTKYIYMSEVNSNWLKQDSDILKKISDLYKEQNLSLSFFTRFKSAMDKFIDTMCIEYEQIQTSLYTTTIKANIADYWADKANKEVLKEQKRVASTTQKQQQIKEEQQRKEEQKELNERIIAKNEEELRYFMHQRSLELRRQAEAERQRQAKIQAEREQAEKEKKRIEKEKQMAEKAELRRIKDELKAKQELEKREQIKKERLDFLKTVKDKALTEYDELNTKYGLTLVVDPTSIIEWHDTYNNRHFDYYISICKFYLTWLNETEYSRYLLLRSLITELKGCKLPEKVNESLQYNLVIQREKFNRIPEICKDRTQIDKLRDRYYCPAFIKLDSTDIGSITTIVSKYYKVDKNKLFKTLACYICGEVEAGSNYDEHKILSTLDFYIKRNSGNAGYNKTDDVIESLYKDIERIYKPKNKKQRNQCMIDMLIFSNYFLFRNLYPVNDRTGKNCRTMPKHISTELATHYANLDIKNNLVERFKYELSKELPLTIYKKGIENYPTLLPYALKPVANITYHVLIGVARLLDDTDTTVQMYYGIDNQFHIIGDTCEWFCNAQIFDNYASASNIVTATTRLDALCIDELNCSTKTGLILTIERFDADYLYRILTIKEGNNA